MSVEVLARGLVRILEIQRADRRNPIDRSVAEGLERAAGDVNADPHARVVVLAGAGPVFCAGADLTVRLRGPEASAEVFRSVRRASLAVRGLAVPAIAAIQGYALGAGLELAASCDYRIAERHARVGLPEVQQGIASGGGLLALASLLPRGALARIALTGEVVDADEALALGIVDEVVEDGDARGAALALAERIAEHPRDALVATKAVLRVAYEPDWASRWSSVGHLQEALEGGPSQREALARLAADRRARRGASPA